MATSQEIHQQPPQSEPQANLLDKLKKWLEVLGLAFSLASALATAVGVMLTIFYLSSIGFFPTGLTLGDALLFVAVTVVFGMVYSALLIIGAFCSLWLAAFVHYLLSNAKPCTLGKIIAWLLGIAFVVAMWILLQLDPRQQNVLISLYMVCALGFLYFLVMVLLLKFWTWVKQHTKEDGAAPREHANGRTVEDNKPFPIEMSVVSYVVSIVLSATIYALVAQSSDEVRNIQFITVFITFILTGLMLSLFFLAGRTRFKDKPQTKTDRAWMWAGVVMVTLLPIVFFHIGPFLLNTSFGLVGIRKPNVTLEIPNAYAGTIELIAESIHKPLIDCRTTRAGTILLRNVDVLWTGIGSQTRVAFTVREKGNVEIFGPPPRVLREASLSFDANTIRIIEAKPASPRCFELPSDLFEGKRHELTLDGAVRLHNIAAEIENLGTPRQIEVRAYSDDPRPISRRDKQPLSVLRAKEVADALARLLKDPKPIMVAPSAREPNVSCSPGGNQDKCKKPNRRVEIWVTWIAPPPGNASRRTD